MVKKISVSDYAYQLLNKLREELGTSTHSDTILVLAERARLCEKLDERLERVERLLARLLEEVAARRGAREPRGSCEGGDDWRASSRPVM